MQKKKFRSFDDYLIKKFRNNPKDARCHLKNALEDFIKTGELIYLLMAIKNVVKAKGVCETAKKMRIKRQTLWRILRLDKNPRMKTITKLLKILDYPFSNEKLA